MIANFHINYGTVAGEQITIVFKKNAAHQTIYCQGYDATNWQCAIEVTENEVLEYKYVLQSFKGELPEHGEFRRLQIPAGQAQVFIHDYWRPQYEVERNYFSAAFRDVIFKRAAAPAPTMSAVSDSGNTLVFKLYAAAIPQHLQFCLVGNHAALGDWKKPVLLSEKDFPTWQVSLPWAGQQVDIEYKFAFYDPSSGQILEWEDDKNRFLQFTFPTPAGNVLVRTDESFKYEPHSRFRQWHGTGMAIPVFSLRSEKGLGIGEFNDLRLLTDWAVKTGMKLIQTLPVNDTIATKTWTDSYPYAAISVFALHPLYVNLPTIAKLVDKKSQARLQAATKALNQLEAIDFEQVLKTKFEFFKLLFAQEKAAFFEDPAAQAFIEKNAEWLKPYAAFCHLRDLNGTTQFHHWEKYTAYSQQVVADLCQSNYVGFDDVALYYFIQYHAHRQLFGATEYARQHGVVLKGDLPIGIYRYSCDAWVAPQLYNMDGQAGAPPDPYSDSGQNWGFPTYNWEVMANDDFAWWRKRMAKLAEYFDALRIDHILGFFRIWQIPTDQVEGTLGLFNPRLPYTREELNSFGLTGSLERYVQPYIRGHFLQEMFGEDADFVRLTFLDETSYSVFRLKDFVSNQLKIKELFANEPKLAGKKHLEKGLMRLVSNVLLLEETLPGGTIGFNPRITIHSTRSYKDLNDFEKSIFNRLYDDYFFVRHDEFWRQQALWKLPALLRATAMLICGEDLGMIPKSVPGVMQDLNILTLEIQRMPKGNAEFGEPTQYPFTSVCSPSCHDMPTIRGWWENDPAVSQQFFEKCLHQKGVAPQPCSTGIVEEINRQHLLSPSMWAIFPVQDLVGMDARLRRPVASDEQINDPANPQHYWRFRFHLPVEQLLLEEGLNEKIKEMISGAGR